MNRRFENAAVAGSIALLLVVALHWWRPGHVIATVDIAPQVDYWWQLKSGFWAWNYVSSPFGSISPGPGVLVYLGLGALLQSVFHASLAQILLMWLMLAASWVGVYLCARSLAIPVLGAFAAAWAYTFNPYQMLQVSVVTFMWTLAVLPWFAWLLIRANREPERRRGIMLAVVALALLALPVLGATPQLLFETFVDLIVLQLCLMSETLRPRDFWARFVPGALAGTVIVSLWWLLPSLISYKTSTLTHSINVANNSWIYARSSLLNNIRFTASWAWVPNYGYFPFTAWYDRNLIVYAAGFAPFVASCLALLLTKGRQRRLVASLTLSALAVIFVSKGLHEPFAAINAAFFQIPLAYLYQEPAGATAFALLAFALCFGLLIEAIPFNARAFAVAIAILLDLVSVSPLLAGNFFHEGSIPLPSVYVSIPEYWSKLAEYVNRNSAKGAVLVLPADSTYQAQYSFGYFGLDYVPRMLLHRPVLMLGASSAGYLADPVSESINQQVRGLLYSGSKLSLETLRHLGVAFVVLRGDVVDEPPGVSRDDLARILRTHAHSFGPLDLYEIPRAQPQVLAYRDWIGGSYDGWAPGQFIQLQSLTENEPRLIGRSLPTGWRKERKIFETTGFDPATIRRVTDNDTRSVMVAASFRGCSCAAENPPVTANIPISAPLNNQLGLGTVPYLRVEKIENGIHPEVPLIDYALGFYDLTIMNPSDRYVRAKVSIAVRPPFAVRMAIRSKLTGTAAFATPSRNLVWATGNPIVIPPLRSHLFITVSRASAQPNTAPPYVPTTAEGFQEFAVGFTDVKVETKSPPALDKPAGAPLAYALPLARVDLGLKASTAAYLNVDINGYRPANSVEAVLTLAGTGTSRACASPFPFMGQVDLQRSVSECIRSERVAATIRDLDRITIKDVAFFQLPDRTLQDEEVARISGVQLSLGPDAPRIHAVPEIHSPYARASIATDNTGRLKIFLKPRLRPPAQRVLINPLSLIWRLGSPLGKGDVVAFVLDGASFNAPTLELGSNELHLSPGPAPRLWSTVAHVVRPTDKIEIHADIPMSREAATPVNVSAYVANSTEPAVVRVELGRDAIQIADRGDGVARRDLKILSRGDDPQPVSVRYAAPSVSLLAIGSAQQNVRPVFPQTLTWPLGIIVAKVPLDFHGVLAMNTRYSPYWGAFEFGSGLSSPIHTAADGWRNAWLISRGGTILLINDLNPLMLLLLFLAVVYVAVSWIRLRAHNRISTETVS